MAVYQAKSPFASQHRIPYTHTQPRKCALFGERIKALTSNAETKREWHTLYVIFAILLVYICIVLVLYPYKLRNHSATTETATAVTLTNVGTVFFAARTTTPHNFYGTFYSIFCGTPPSFWVPHRKTHCARQI